ncbi:hypothetical protein KUM42_03055 [Modestobacter sp. L9-4]|uniref:hypothetical protein n=1 Tax=Modestobacter sp. L9-4 TaxID=2851567 RepID=UPI001C741823|nr:hypothetical protein [Modestobacter sp. L9-4]QXG76547.1 hypothetical protein KUM42_03055 [Modestobacter sp. L9-4]
MARHRTALRTIAPWAVLVLPLLDVVLVVSGVLPPAVGVVVAVVGEVLLVPVAFTEWALFREGWRSARAQGGDRRAAALAGFTAAAPAPVVRAARAEAGTWRSLWWAVRRRRAVAPEELPLSYTSRIGVMLWVTVLLSPLEIVVVHLLLPWEPVRLVVLVVSVVSLVWLLGFTLALQQRPHVLGADVLVLRFGHLREVVVRAADIADARAGTTVDHRRVLELADGAVSLSVLGESSVRLRLHPAATVLVDGCPVPAGQVTFFADDARGAVRELRARAAPLR